ncbi:hypothetical protein IMSAGC009_02107 [Lachnospiraceae bacterium]|nr:hypothetical protein IMSAGC009_02107 [Lachnospiraceae bacterium]
MGKQNSSQSKLYPHADKEKHQGDAGDDISVKHGNIRYTKDHGPGAFFQIHNGNTGNGSNDGRCDRGYKGDKKGIK